ncbi:hypothetical protein D3C73_563060 [compost metagenome]
MSIDASDAKGTDSCPTWQFPALRVLQRFPFLGFPDNVERASFQLNVRIESIAVQALRQGFMFQLKQDFDHSCHSRRQRQMPDVRLHGAQSAVLAKHLAVPGFPVQFLEGRLQTVHFDRIAKRRPRPVRFDIGDRARIDPRLGIRRLQQIGLRLRVRRRQRICTPSMVHCCATDHAVNMIAVPFCCAQPLEQNHSGAFAVREAVRTVGEGLAFTFLA